MAAQLIGKQYVTQIDVSDVTRSAITAALNDFSACQASNENEFQDWLRGLLINDLLHKVRLLNQSKHDIQREASLSSLGEFQAEPVSPSSELAKQEDEQRLFRALETLSEPDQQVIRLRNQDKLKFAEIGEIMNQTKDSARMLWTRAVKKLAKKIH